MGKRGIRLQSTFQRLFTDEVEERSAAARAAALISAGDTAVDLIPAEELPPAADSLAETKITHYSAYLPALDSAYRVGHVVVDSIVENWAIDRDHLPGSVSK